MSGNEPSSSLYTRPDWVRRMNAMGDAVGGPEKLVPWDVEGLCETARAATGLEDFGNVDGDWRGRLESLVAAFDNAAGLHTVGRLITRAELLRSLGTRLRMTKRLADTPSIADEVVKAPIVVTGPARSGTSLLLELLDLDPRLHGPRGWESTNPMPVGEAASADEAERARLSEFEYDFWNDVQPEFQAVHDLHTNYPQECIHLQMPSFAGGYWTTVANVEGWIPDLAASMQFHKFVLQTLQHGAGERTWVLKTPIYLAMIDQLFDAYPDAWVIHTHRDPVKTAISGASTLAATRWIRSDDVDVSGVASGDGMGFLLMGLMERRKAGDVPDRFVDLHFADLMADPVATVERTYAQMDRELLGEHADAIRRYIENRPRAKFGKHAYSAEQWGFDADALREKMRPYTDHYGVALES